MNPIETLKRKASFVHGTDSRSNGKRDGLNEAVEVLTTSEPIVYCVVDGDGDLLLVTFTRRKALNFIKQKAERAESNRMVQDGRHWTYLASDLTEFTRFRVKDDSIVTTYRVIERKIKG